jgi:sodium transport system permease protein
MNKIFTIARKEFLDTLRDRRAIIMMVAIPLLLFPVLFYAVIAVQASQEEKARNKQLKIGWVEQGNAEGLARMIEEREDAQLIRGIALADTASLLRSDSLDLIVVAAPNFDEQLDSLESGNIKLYHETSDNDRIEKRGEALVKAYEQQLLSERLGQLALSPANIDPINFQTRNVASKREVIGKLVGGFLPYIFVIFSFMGCMYPAIDLFAGEKERGTIETILSVPVNRMQILAGKLIVVATAGVLSAIVAMAGLGLSVSFLPIPDQILSAVGSVAQLGNILLILAMVIPLAIFFASLITTLSTYAKSYKEAQSLVAPMNILVIVPAAIGLVPGIELNLGTALIPVLNVALASKEIIAGTINYGFLSVVILSLVVLAVAGVWFSARWFSSEKNILRS